MKFLFVLQAREADVARLEREIREAAAAAEGVQRRLTLDVAREAGAKAAAMREVDLLGADLAAERDRCVALRKSLELKVGGTGCLWGL